MMTTTNNNNKSQLMNRSQAFAEIIRDLYRHPDQTETDLNRAIVDRALAVTKKESIDLDGSYDDPAAYLNRYNDWFEIQLRKVFRSTSVGRRRSNPLASRSRTWQDHEADQTSRHRN